jgi:hypothetical protein
MVEHTLRLSRLRHAIHDDAERALSNVRAPAIVFHEVWRTEVMHVGWVMDSFPKRRRDPDAPIVTFPRPPAKLLPDLLAAYPNRNCYYFHRRPSSGAPELLQCEQAASYLERGSSLPPSVRHQPLWLPPTAYKRVPSFDPRGAARERNAGLDACVLCCQLRLSEQSGEALRPDLRCISER